MPLIWLAAPTIRRGLKNVMKRLAFVIAGTAALTLSACNRGNEDAVQNAELNQAATDAANDAANSEAAALGNQAAELNAANAAAEDNTTNPSDAQEQNVSGM